MKQTHKEKWLATMIKKYGSEEAVKEVLRAGQKKSRENYAGTGGFAANPELAKEAGKKGAEKRWNNAYKDNTSTKTKNNTKG